MANYIDDSHPDLSEEDLQSLLSTSTYPTTDKVQFSNLSELFKVPENPQYTYATFTESFERYKVKVDVVKWLIGTVGLTVITFIINWGFKDREQGIAELQVYDRYASETVVFAENPKNRLLLAQFFATVTPSDKLKEGWKEYLQVVKSEVDAFNLKIKQNQLLVAQLAKDTLESVKAKEIYFKAKDYTDELKRINNIQLVDEEATVLALKKTSRKSSRIDLARDFELKGFNALLSKDINTAISNFKLSENSFNGYHAVYDIAKYLQITNSNFSNTTKDWNTIYKDILQKYSWKMPKDIKKRMSAASKQ